MSFVLSNAIAGEPVDLTPPYTSDDSGSDPDISSGAGYKTIISYQDKNQYLSDVPWTVKILGQSASDSLLEQAEKAEITVWLLRRDNDVANATDSNGFAKYTTTDVNGASGILTTGSLLTENDQFTLQIKPSSGAVLTVQRIVPARLDDIMDLK